MKGPFQSLLPGLFYWDHFSPGLSPDILNSINQQLNQSFERSESLFETQQQVQQTAADALIRQGLLENLLRLQQMPAVPAEATENVPSAKPKPSIK
jgi:hypothetical protein